MENELISFRSDMLKFAWLQLRDEATAEDAVQETLKTVTPTSNFGKYLKSASPSCLKIRHGFL